MAPNNILTHTMKKYPSFYVNVEGITEAHQPESRVGNEEVKIASAVAQISPRPRPHIHIYIHIAWVKGGGIKAGLTQSQYRPGDGLMAVSWRRQAFSRKASSVAGRQAGRQGGYLHTPTIQQL
jgi:hypothetical protein